MSVACQAREGDKTRCVILRGERASEEMGKGPLDMRGLDMPERAHSPCGVIEAEADGGLTPAAGPVAKHGRRC